MHYYLTLLNEELVFIKWYKHPIEWVTRPARDFIQNLEYCFDNASSPLYLLSDFSLCRINDVRVIQALGELTEHPQWGGAVSFSKDSSSNSFVGVLSNYAASEKNVAGMQGTLEQAVMRLEALKPGITANVDWHQFMQQVAQM
jgi:hypothetical protein